MIGDSHHTCYWASKKGNRAAIDEKIIRMVLSNLQGSDPKIHPDCASLARPGGEGLFTCFLRDTPQQWRFWATPQTFLFQTSSPEPQARPKAPHRCLCTSLESWAPGPLPPSRWHALCGPAPKSNQSIRRKRNRCFLFSLLWTVTWTRQFRIPLSMSWTCGDHYPALKTEKRPPEPEPGRYITAGFSGTLTEK